MIRAEGVTKTFGSIKALENASIKIKKGSVYGLIGPNGAGKTTLIKNIAGIYCPESGSVKINDKEVFENPEAKAEITYIGDELYFFSTYTIHDTAKFYAGIYKNWNWERFEKLKEFFKIDIDRRVSRLSKGMQKQVALWIGLCTGTSVMVLDEADDGLDPIIRKQIWRIILKDVEESEKTVLITSHNLRALENICDHVGIINQGHVVLEKEIDDIKGNIHKIQLAFKDEFPEELRFKTDIMHIDSIGRVHMVIVRGDIEIIMDKLKQFSPIICDVLPLSLEEIFVYELGGMGYEFENIIIQ